MSLASRSKRVGWWGWGPALYGAAFLVVGVMMIVGGTALPTTASDGLYGSGGLFVVIGVVSLLFAWRISRDIKSGDAPAKLPGALAEETERELRSTGVPGSATVRACKLLGGSAEGTTLVELDLTVMTTRLGTVSVKHRSRMPIGMMSRLRAGSTVPVTVDPDDPQRLLVDWAGLTAV